MNVRPELKHTSAEKPLLGFRVLDFSQYAPGPFVTRALCDLGASVMKIEPPGGDPLSHMFVTETGESPIYAALNHGKVIVRINLKDADAIQEIRGRVSSADILVEGFRPGVMDRLGLGVKTCQNLAPALVYCSITGYGQDGPYAMKAGHDINYCAAAGLLSYTEVPTLFPLVGDHSGAQNAISLILAAALGSTRTGKGRYLDVSLYEPMLAWQYSNQQPGEESNNPLALLWGESACYNIYTTADQRRVTLGALEPAFWRNFCVAVDRPDWIERHHEAMPQQSLINELSGLFALRSLSHWNETLGQVDCCFEPIPLPAEIFSHPQTVARSLFEAGTTGIAEPSMRATGSEYPASKLHISDHCPVWDSV